MNTLKLSAALTLALGMTCALASSAHAQTKRTCKVFVENRSGKEIETLTLIHKYSDNYKNSFTWVELPSGQTTKFPLPCEYNTGTFTTGKDWWLVEFTFKGDKAVYATAPNNFRGAFDAIEGAFIKYDLGKKIGNILGSVAGGAAGGAIGTAAAPGAGTTIGTAAGKAVGGAAGSLAGKELQAALMNGEKTEGFKQHILRKADELTPTYIKIWSSTVTFESASGKSETNYKKVGEVK